MANNGDNLKKVRSGEPLVIPADTHNAFIDAVNWVRQQQHGLGSQQSHLPSDTRLVPIRNDTGADVAAQSVLAITGVVLDPADGGNTLLGFRQQPVLIGQTPLAVDTLTGHFVITSEPIRKDEIGYAVASGTTAVRLLIQNDSDNYADVVASNNTCLMSSTGGPANILWKPENQAGQTVWAFVRFGASSGVTSKLVRIVSVFSAGTNKWKYWCIEVQPSVGDTYHGGTYTDGVTAFYAYNRSEWGNAEDGVQGNGVNVDNMIGTFLMQPFPVGRLLRVEWEPRTKLDSTSTGDWVFDLPNAVDGDCNSA